MKAALLCLALCSSAQAAEWVPIAETITGRHWAFRTGTTASAAGAHTVTARVYTPSGPERVLSASVDASACRSKRGVLTLSGLDGVVVESMRYDERQFTAATQLAQALCGWVAKGM